MEQDLIEVTNELPPLTFYDHGQTVTKQYTSRVWISEERRRRNIDFDIADRRKQVKGEEE